MKYEDVYLLVVSGLIIVGFGLAWLFIKYMPPIKIIIV